ncbi:MAG TPA: HAD hydrolase-like protein, partial [Candidatus Ozemobacteraceae bacterium]|nr:HAD hydrolase-like protein [Candidatus Ozemobacteraceae bacterium]
MISKPSSPSRLPWDVLLCDIDGTLMGKTSSGVCEAFSGAPEALKEIRRRVRTAFVTNTTSESRCVIHQRLNDLGFPCLIDEIYTPWAVARKVMQDEGRTRGFAFLPPRDRTEADWFTPDLNDGNAVLVADESLDATFRQVQEAFRLLMRGGKLYTLQRNRFYRGSDGLCLDLGPLTAALEYASGQQAVVFGKPSPTLFARIAADYGASPDRMAIVGDDAEFDVA